MVEALTLTRNVRSVPIVNLDPRDLRLVLTVRMVQELLTISMKNQDVTSVVVVFSQKMTPLLVSTACQAMFAKVPPMPHSP